MSSEDSIDKVRFHIFFAKIKYQKLYHRLVIDTLQLHIKRYHYQSLIRKKVYCPRPTLHEAIKNIYNLFII